MHKSVPEADPSPLRTEVADEVRARIAYCRTTQEQVAKDIGRSQQWMSRRLNYELPFTVEDLAKIAGNLNTTVFSLLKGLDPEPDEKALDRRGLRKPRSACIAADDLQNVLTVVVPNSEPFLIAA
jgi:transcriptional regulator with XRE-family HTH domain